MFVVARRVAIGVIGSGAVTDAMLSTGAGSALADPPNCTAADLAGVASGVSAATSAYLFTHPDVNNFFSRLQGRPASRCAPTSSRTWTPTRRCVTS
jgi:hypothetical protein